MSIVLTILFWLVVVLFAALVGAIVTPIKLQGHLSSSPHLTYRIEAQAFGGLSPRLVLVDSTRPVRTAHKKPKQNTPAKARKTRGARLVETRGMGSAISALIRDLLGAVHIDKVRIDAEFGLDDPADTGRLFGQLTPFQYGMPLPERTMVSLRPHFGGAYFVGQAEAVLKITLAALLPPAVRFAWRVYGPGQ